MLYIVIHTVRTCKASKTKESLSAVRFRCSFFLASYSFSMAPHDISHQCEGKLIRKGLCVD